MTKKKQIIFRKANVCLDNWTLRLFLYDEGVDHRNAETVSAAHVKFFLFSFLLRLLE